MSGIGTGDRPGTETAPGAPASRHTLTGAVEGMALFFLARFFCGLLGGLFGGSLFHGSLLRRRLGGSLFRRDLLSRRLLSGRLLWSRSLLGWRRSFRFRLHRHWR